MAVPFPALVADGDGRLVFANTHTERLLHTLGLTVEDFDPTSLVQLQDERQPSVRVNAQLSGGEYIAKAVQLGNTQRFFLRATRVDRPEGSYFCCVLVSSQVTEAVDYSELLDTVGCIVLQLCPNGRIGYLNQAVSDQLGYDLCGDKPPLEVLAQLEVNYSGSRWKKRVDRAHAGETVVYEAGFRCRDGRELPVEVTLLRDHFADNGIVTLTARDISRQLQTERELRQALQQVSKLSAGYRRENQELRRRIRREQPGEIVSADSAYLSVLRQIDQVAPTATTVLITGETGTGKELIARRLHALSDRAEQPFVVVDCSALPDTLIESELFGYQKGAFTGAIADRRGHFEAADGGTIFLDEIGELPLELQPRLLRVLQEQSFVPLGATETVAIDVRVIAATNRELRAEVAAGRFRSDLFFRLNVFPIFSLPLRERPDDVIPLLWHFIRKHNPRIGRSVEQVDQAVVDLLRQYPFPGNIRELENLTERALILCNGHCITLRDVDIPFTQPPVSLAINGNTTAAAAVELISLQEQQKRYIKHVLTLTDGKVSGKGGAAEILQINPQTLFGRMRKLGIR